MKFLQILNIALLVLGAAMATVLSVVCLLYWVYLDSDPGLRRDVPTLLTVTGGFLSLAVGAGLAFAGQRRNWTLRWLLQMIPVLPLAGLIAFAGSFR